MDYCLKKSIALYSVVLIPLQSAVNFSWSILDTNLSLKPSQRAFYVTDRTTLDTVLQSLKGPEWDCLLLP